MPPPVGRGVELRRPTASSSGLGLVNRSQWGPPETPAGGPRPHQGPPGPPLPPAAGALRGPFWPLILGGAKKCTFLAPCGAKS